jgi:hypothetical protein
MNKSGNKKRTLLNIPYNERHIQLLYKLFVKKYLTTFQIWWLFFRHTKHLKVCQEFLRKLRDTYGLIRSIEVAYKRGTPRPHLIWAITDLGREILAYECGVDPHLLSNTKPWANEENNLKIKHILACTDFELVLRDACEQTGITLEEILEAQETTHHPLRQQMALAGAGGEEYRPPIPDQLITLNSEGLRAIFHVEIDRATEPLESVALSSYERETIAGKVLAYLTYADTDYYNELFGDRPLRVAFITQGQRRLHNMVAVTEKVLKRYVRYREDLPEDEKQQKWEELLWLRKRFRFLANAHADTLLTHPVWSVPGYETLQTMFE